MPRALRIEYPGALYHVTARGTRQGAIFLDDRDRAMLLTILAEALQEYEARAFAFCLMGNHYHFVLQTGEANLSVLMRQINSLYSQAFNMRHGRRGHVFEGRYKALHVDRDAYLLEVCRYVDLNPVRAGFVDSPVRWRWSSYRSHVGLVRSPEWLATAEMHGLLAGPGSADHLGAATGCRQYAEWVCLGRDRRLWRESLRHGLYLGDEAFVERVRQRRG